MWLIIVNSLLARSTNNFEDADKTGTNYPLNNDFCNHSGSIKPYEFYRYRPARLKGQSRGEVEMNIIKGYNPLKHSKPIKIHKARGVTLVEKSGENLYVLPDDGNTEPQCGYRLIPQFDFKAWAEQSTDLDGFYCFNSITQTANYLGSEWDDIPLGLKFRGLAA